MKKNIKIFIAGSNGMVGSSVLRKFKSLKFKNIITRSRKELNLENSAGVYNFFKKQKPEYVIIASAKVGGILANTSYPVEFLQSNLKIQNNLIENSFRFGVKKLIFLGSSCIYPLSKKKLSEKDLLSGKVEPTNESYAMAKISGMKLCEAYKKQYGCDFRSIIPCNLYGYGDNYHLNNSHVLPALIRKFSDAIKNNKKKVEIWGDGSPIREFMFVDDLAESVYTILGISKVKYDRILKKNKISFLNVGTSKEISIKNLAYLIKKITKFRGKIFFNTKYPNGNPYKVLSCRISHKIWKPKVDLKNGIKKTYDDYINNFIKLRK